MPLQTKEQNQDNASHRQIIRSEGLQEIISRRPSFLKRWALIFFVVLILLMIAGTWFIHYPDIVTAKGTLVGTNTPKEIIAKSEGKIVRLFVKNADTVKKGDMIAWLESNATHSQVLDLSARLDTMFILLQQNRTDKIRAFFKTNLSQLGELQNSYEQFITSYQKFIDYLVTGYYFKRRTMLQKDIVGIQKTKLNLETQKNLFLQDIQLSEEEYKANEELYESKVISTQDFRTQKSKLLTKQMTIPQLQTSLLAIEGQERDKIKEIAELEHDISQQKLVFQQVLQSMVSSVNEWKMKYIILAPVDGEISFTSPLQENQFFRQGKQLGFVNPFESSFYAELNLEQSNYGKVKIGQQVQLHFDAYPFYEFGYVKGDLQYISNIATDSGFIAYVRLPNKLITNQNKVIQYKSGLKADAKIVTNDMRLLNRFYYRLSEMATR